MDPINLIAGLNLVITFGANMSGAKKGLHSSITAAKEKPKTYLQKLPLILSTITLIAFIVGLFQFGTISYTGHLQTYRIVGLAFYIVFSWLQIWAYKALGSNYSQDVLIFKDHKLITKGPFKFLRHPQYLSQVFVDLGAGFATLSYIVIPITIIEIPFIILRASLEEKLLEKHFKDDFRNYKSKSGFIIPFIG
jgi:protein-S-isoprenylcysteine O-methyltransferase Ste14